MIQGGTATWNIRDTHMMDTLKRLMEFYGRDDSKSIVWAHNTHIGDARYTDMADAKMVNIGQLVREYASEKNVFSVGFGTYQGSCYSAKEWGDKMQRIDVPPAVDGSWDNLIHNQSNGRNTLLVFRDYNDNQRNRGDSLLKKLEAKEEAREQLAWYITPNTKGMEIMYQLILPKDTMHFYILIKLVLCILFICQK